MQAVIAQLENLLKQYTSRLQIVSEDDFARKISPEKWSKKEIPGLLVDSAQNNIQRFVRASYENRPHIICNQEAWVLAQGYQNYPSAELIMLRQLLNKHNCAVLGNIAVETYTHLCDTGKEGARLYTVAFLANDYKVHIVHHLKQIFNN